jgi:hypothetical protein
MPVPLLIPAIGAFGIKLWFVAKGITLIKLAAVGAIGIAGVQTLSDAETATGITIKKNGYNQHSEYPLTNEDVARHYHSGQDLAIRLCPDENGSMAVISPMVRVCPYDGSNPVQDRNFNTIKYMR